MLLLLLCITEFSSNHISAKMFSDSMKVDNTGSCALVVVGGRVVVVVGGGGYLTSENQPPGCRAGLTK